MDQTIVLLISPSPSAPPLPPALTACLLHLQGCLWFSLGSSGAHQLPLYCLVGFVTYEASALFVAATLLRQACKHCPPTQWFPSYIPDSSHLHTCTGACTKIFNVIKLLHGLDPLGIALRSKTLTQTKIRVHAMTEFKNFMNLEIMLYHICMCVCAGVCTCAFAFASPSEISCLRCVCLFSCHCDASVIPLTWSHIQGLTSTSWSNISQRWIASIFQAFQPAFKALEEVMSLIPYFIVSYMNSNSLNVCGTCIFSFALYLHAMRKCLPHIYCKIQALYT